MEVSNHVSKFAENFNSLADFAEDFIISYNIANNANLYNDFKCLNDIPIVHLFDFEYCLKLVLKQSVEARKLAFTDIKKIIDYYRYSIIKQNCEIVELDDYHFFNGRYVIYLHVCPDNTAYCGITDCIELRNIQHASGSHSEKFRNAINLFGWPNIQHSIVARNLPKKTALALEMAFIAHFAKTYSMMNKHGSKINKAFTYDGQIVCEPEKFLAQINLINNSE